MIKQVIVMRRDLGMRRGKQIAQGAHASLKVFLDRKIPPSEVGLNGNVLIIPMPEDMAAWANGLFTKITVQVSSEEDLLTVHKAALEADLPVALIQDAGKTEFGGVPTYTCLAVGPAQAEDVDKVTGHLKLY